MGGFSAINGVSTAYLSGKHSILVCLEGGGGGGTQVTGLQGGVLPGGTLSVVVVPDHNPAQAVLLVVTSYAGDGVVLPAQLVLDAVDAVVLAVEGADEHVV
jgi:hypothetical protein